MLSGEESLFAWMRILVDDVVDKSIDAVEHHLLIVSVTVTISSSPSVNLEEIRSLTAYRRVAVVGV
jgi:hypothetical protein